MTMRLQLRRLRIVRRRRSLLKNLHPNTPLRQKERWLMITVNNFRRIQSRRSRIGRRVLIMVGGSTSSSKMEITGLHRSRQSWSQMARKRCRFITKGSTIRVWLLIGRPLCMPCARLTSHHHVYSNPTWLPWKRQRQWKCLRETSRRLPRSKIEMITQVTPLTFQKFSEDHHLDRWQKEVR